MQSSVSRKPKRTTCLSFLLGRHKPRGRTVTENSQPYEASRSQFLARALFLSLPAASACVPNHNLHRATGSYFTFARRNRCTTLDVDVNASNSIAQQPSTTDVETSTTSTRSARYTCYVGDLRQQTTKHQEQPAMLKSGSSHFVIRGTSEALFTAGKCKTTEHFVPGERLLTLHVGQRCAKYPATAVGDRLLPGRRNGWHMTALARQPSWLDTEGFSQAARD